MFVPTFNAYSKQKLLLKFDEVVSDENYTYSKEESNFLHVITAINVINNLHLEFYTAINVSNNLHLEFYKAVAK